MTERTPGLSTLAVHSGNDIDHGMLTHAKSLPIYQSSVFVYDSLAQLDEIAGCNVYIVTVPTPIDTAKRPDLKGVRPL